MALAKGSFFQEELTESQRSEVETVEKLIDDELKRWYVGDVVNVRVRMWEGVTEDNRCKFEILRRYTDAGWKIIHKHNNQKTSHFCEVF